ncbi:MAG: thioesterase family protein [Desulfovibrionaceae bacterium]|nr:thioesterase family protein [Desulfovibrionaceae bacterium]
MTALQPGLKGPWATTVAENMLAESVGSGLVRVFSTAMMIAGMERSAVSAVQAMLADGLTTVGTQVDVRHLAATPCGMEIRFEAVLTQISPNGKGLTFSVQAWDALGLIGEGTHQRVVVNKARFEAKTAAKGTA